MHQYSKVALTLQYRGTQYFGSQFQKEKPTISGELLKALTRITNKKLKLEIASRTDTGVHALGQVISFSKPTNLPPVSKLPQIINVLLPDDIRVIKVAEKPDSFHARFSAVARDYQYLINHRKIDTIQYSWQSWHYINHIDWSKASKILPFLIAKTNWKSFVPRAAENFGFDSELFNLKIYPQKLQSKIFISGRRFLFRQIVLIVGFLIAIGTGKIELDQAIELTQGSNLSKVPITPAPAKGLCLLRVRYKNRGISDEK